MELHLAEVVGVIAALGPVHDRPLELSGTTVVVLPLRYARLTRVDEACRDRYERRNAVVRTRVDPDGATEGDRDLLNPNVMRDNMHDWVVANENMANVLAAKRYHYQFVFARNAGHCDRGVKQQTLPGALEWLWKGYPK
jgi:hypothetical protein